MICKNVYFVNYYIVFWCYFNVCKILFWCVIRFEILVCSVSGFEFMMLYCGVLCKKFKMVVRFVIGVIVRVVNKFRKFVVRRVVIILVSLLVVIKIILGIIIVV